MHSGECLRISTMKRKKENRPCNEVCSRSGVHVPDLQAAAVSRCGLPSEAGAPLRGEGLRSGPHSRLPAVGGEGSRGRAQPFFGRLADQPLPLPERERVGRPDAPDRDSRLSVFFPAEEVAFRKKRLCIKFIPRDSTEAAICDIRIMGRTKQAPPQYTFIG